MSPSILDQKDKPKSLPGLMSLLYPVEGAVPSATENGPEVLFPHLPVLFMYRT
jgi:hypothetical protein